MAPLFYAIAIMGCGDDGATCRQVRVEPARFESVAACEAASDGVLLGATDVDAPTVLARCRRVAAVPAAAHAAPRAAPPIQTAQLVAGAPAAR